MFKYYLNINNEVTHNNYFELHKKSCSVVKAAIGTHADNFIDLGFHESYKSARGMAEKELITRNLDSDLLNGCLACNKSFHKR